MFQFDSRCSECGGGGTVLEMKETPNGILFAILGAKCPTCNGTGEKVEEWKEEEMFRQ